jgi:hypothetical protein
VRRIQHNACGAKILGTDDDPFTAVPPPSAAQTPYDRSRGEGNNQNQYPNRHMKLRNYRCTFRAIDAKSIGS